MKKLILTSALAFLALAGSLQAQDMPQMPTGEKEHDWLQRFVGQWDTEGQATLEPGKPPITCTGTETVRAIGPFWILGETSGKFMDMPMTGIMTVGYDPQTKKYVGTWIDSMNNYMYRYEGTVDAQGKTLTLNSEGPCPMQGGRIAKMKDVVEFKTDDHRVMTSSIQGEDGQWTTMMTMNMRRKK